MEKRSMDQWLDAAVSGIRFKPDRAEAERELRGHLEDKAEDLRRIFPDMSRAEAEERAVSEMGDAEEIGKELARLHKPWLGYLWVASKWALGILLAAFVFYQVTQVETTLDNPVWGGLYSGGYVEPVGLEPKQAELGGYTFRIMEAVYLDYPEESVYHDQIRVTVRVSSPRFWERVDPVAVERSMTAVTGDGTRWRMDRQDINMKVNEYYQVLSGMEQIRWGLFYREFGALMDADWQEGDRVRLDFAFGKGSFSLSAEVTEQVVEP